jgi:SAM-dependent methyltransferase
MDSIASYRPAVGWFRSDEIFNSLYPASIQQLAIRHWTPLRITRAVIDFLTPQHNERVLDIGSGIGKFCLAAAHYKPSAFFGGIEQRASLVKLAEEARGRLSLSNVSFLHGDFINIDFNEYHHFYFYNSFYENLSEENRIDDSIEFTDDLYNYYTRCLHKKLADMPRGTRVVTYHSLEDEIPFTYHTVESKFNNRLRFWEKIE